MLHKLTNTDEPVRLPLLADDQTVQAQFNKARQLVAEELEDRPGEHFSDEILRLVRASVGDSEALKVMQSLQSVAVNLIDKNIRPKQIEKALARLKDTMQDHDAREALAYVRCQLAMQQYRESSNTADLLDPTPEGAAFVTVRALSSDERRKAERAAGHKPRQGALLASRAYDVMRRATREGEDGGNAYAAYVAGLTKEEQAEVDLFEQWSSQLDREVARCGIVSIDGFDLPMVGGKYDVETFLAQCHEGVEVVSESARHIRNLATLGKLPSLSPSLESGTGEQEDAAQV